MNIPYTIRLVVTAVVITVGIAILHQMFHISETPRLLPPLAGMEPS